MRDFPDDETCLDWLWRSLYSSDGKEAMCPKCKKSRPFHRVKSRPSYSCARCGHHIHPTAGTIFHKSSTALHLWFYAIFQMSSTRCGISAKQLEREIGVTYKTAWRMFNKIRTLLREDTDEPIPLRGTVEMDETWVGGRLRYAGGQWRKSPNKKAVFGMVERGGRVVATTVQNVDKANLYPHIQKHILPSATIYTDEANYYTGLAKRGYDHKRIQHALEIYVAGDVHTNTIEGFWSLLKRGISGVYHSVSAKYLQEYLNEYAYRYNHRNDAKPMFLGLLENVDRPRTVDRFGFRLADESLS
ncbi:MAG TPA: IS1595 family transposase [Actinomycetota bacterium]|nr:IS1595 family transposase [Actinomycetota bacterium]